MPRPFSLALASAGRSIAARMAMIAMTTSNSIKVNAPTRGARPGRQALPDLSAALMVGYDSRQIRWRQGIWPSLGLGASGGACGCEDQRAHPTSVVFGQPGISRGGCWMPATVGL